MVFPMTKLAMRIKMLKGEIRMLEGQIQENQNQHHFVSQILLDCP